MKTMGMLVTSVLFAALAVTPVHAQPPAAPHGMAPPPAAMSPAPPSGPPDGSKTAMPMMDMCRDMMGGTAGTAMMGPSGTTDPKERAAMLEMRGEMMKAMGDVMMKHARRMQGMTDK